MTLLLSLALGLALGSAQDAPDFERDVAPILERSCLECHGPERRSGRFSLETRESGLEGGRKGPVLVPGDPGESRLLEVVSPREGGRPPKMPRRREPLTTAEVQILRDWIAAGAAWPVDRRLAPLAEEEEPADTWWSWQPPDPPEVPEAEGARTPIDAFILSKLHEEGLSPNPPADRRTLIRRLTYDLHGLPPTPEEVRAFVADPAPDAEERLIDRLLASPRYAERWARHWLDVVHYGDSHGFDKDKPRPHAWPYRDWVIQAFDQDLPYAEMIRRQLAGDVLAPDDPSALAATGFIAAGPWDFVGHVELREGTRDKEITRSLDRDDMVMTTMSTFASTTVHCARCHDHKFDPIPQRDYYRLQAVFAGVERADREYDPDPELHRRRRALRRELEATAQRLAAIDTELAETTSEHITTLERRIAADRTALARLPAPAEETPSNGYHSAIETAPDVTKWVQVDLGRVVAIDQVVLVPARPVDFPDTPGFGFPSRYRLEASDTADLRAPHALADRTAADQPNPGHGPVVIEGGGHPARYLRLTATLLWERRADWVFALAELQVFSRGENVARGAKVTALDSIEAGFWSKNLLVDGRSSREALERDAGTPPERTALEASLAASRAELSAARRDLRPDLVDERAALLAERERLEAELADLPEPSQVYAATTTFRSEGNFTPPGEPRTIHVLGRGDVDQPLEEVGPGALSGLPFLAHHFEGLDASNEGQRRAALADWLIDEQNPLTWRSIVNRIWHYHFGRGLVDTPNDFGRMGSEPTHPELLDWLAIWFRDSGGSLKELHRLILTSAVYQQSSAHRPEAAVKDGDNRLLWRAPRRRLEAEAIRDGLLAMSGQLDLTMFGPAVRQFVFVDDHSPVYDYRSFSPADAAHRRRSIYRFIVRSVPDPFFECLDAADPSALVAKRTETLTPQHALALLNDPFVLEQAEHLAERVLRESPADPLARIFWLALSRPPTTEERALLEPLARDHGWAAVARCALNLNELIFID